MYIILVKTSDVKTYPKCIRMGPAITRDAWARFLFRTWVFFWGRKRTRSSKVRIEIGKKLSWKVTVEAKLKLNLPTLLGFFQLKWKLSNFRLSNLKHSNYWFFQTTCIPYNMVHIIWTAWLAVGKSRSCKLFSNFTASRLFKLQVSWLAFNQLRQLSYPLLRRVMYSIM